MSYYDVDAILTDAETIPCDFQIDVPGLGYLDQNPAADTLRAGTRVLLPLWLAEMLALAGGGGADDDPSSSGGGAAAAADPRPAFLALNLPPALRNEVVQALKADPRAVPLRDQSAHFYGLATRMLDLFEDADLAAVLRAAFVRRTAEVALHARKLGAQAGAGGGGGGGGGVYLGGGGGGGSSSGNTGGGSSGGPSSASDDRKDDAAAGNTSSNLGLGWAGQEFLRGLDEWERAIFRQAHDGAKAAREFVDNVKRNY